MFIPLAQSQTTTYTANNIDSLPVLSEEQQKKIDAAFTAMQAVQDAGTYIESISDLLTNNRITLPVGIKKGDYELIIQKITYDEDTDRPRIYATCAFKFKDDGQQIAFEGNVNIEGQKGLGTSGQLELIAPVKRKLGDQVCVIVKDGTKASFGCEGIESFHALLDIVITSDKIETLNNKGKVTGNLISTSVETDFFDFDNYVVSINLDQKFRLKNMEDIIFTIGGASLDQSDTITSSMAKFPDGYFLENSDEEIRLWKGVAITEASIMLPAIFNNDNISVDSSQQESSSKATASSETTDSTQSTLEEDRITLQMSDVLIDENGFTGNVSANDIISSDAIDKSKWDLSLSDFTFNILKNDLASFGFGGSINIPPFGDNSLLPYTASFNPAIEEYEFTVNLEGDYDLPVLKSQLSLNETSTIEILFKDNDFYPTVNASGLLSINAPTGKSDNAKKFTVPDITFENLKISRDEPYFEIGAIGVTGSLKTPELAGFSLEISEIKSFNDDDGSGLAFNAGVSVNKSFSGDTDIRLYGDYANWAFDHVGVDKVHIDFKSKAFSVIGGVEFKNGDAIYGTGFRGDLDFTLINKFELQAVAVFGKKDDYRYFLTDVFFETSPLSGLTPFPGLTFYGIGGGIYRRMQQSYNDTIDSDFGKALSGINYIPDNSVGMGFMAATKFSLTGASSAFNAKVAFEMQFNNSGGLNFIQLRGDASFMDDAGKWGKLADNINDKVKAKEAAGGKLKLSAKSDLKVPENKDSGFLTASLDVKYDIANSVFSADLSTYLDAGFIYGIGENNRMGWASAYFSPDKWYTYLGTPDDRLGVEVAGLFSTSSYFMIGDDIPELPSPPNKVLQNFSQEKIDKLNSRSTDELSSGKGIAFGNSASIEFNASLTPFYANMGVGMGAEFLLKNYGSEAYCQGSSTTLGINGWYARAQAWAWVEADIGMKAKIFGRTRKFSIMDVSASALLTGAGPNPFYFTGTVGGQFSVMGGLVSGKCDFDFEIGEECIVKGGSPFGESIIAQLTPAENEDDVSVFASPQVVFNIPVDLAMPIDEEGNQVYYKVTLEEFKVYNKDTKQAVEGLFELSSDSKVYVLNPTEPFESQTDMVVYAKVGFKRKLNGSWIYVKGSDGNPVYEEQSAEFVSGDRPSVILPEHVKFSYPIDRQYNFYPNEYNKGYIMVTENYSYLFSTDKPEGYNQVLRYTDIEGSQENLDFTYTVKDAGEDIRLIIDYPISTNLTNDQIYDLSIVNTPVSTTTDITSNVSSNTENMDDNSDLTVTTQTAEGTLEMLDEEEIYSLYFRTSKYNTFKQKMANYNTKGTGWRDYIEPFVHYIKANITDDEFFDINEMQWLNDDFPIIRFEAQLDNTSWFKNSIYKDMYESIQYSNVESERSNIDSHLNDYGYPPVHAVEIQNLENDKQLTDDEIETGTPAGVYAYGIFTYSLPYWCSKDFYMIKTQIANKVADGKSLTNDEEAILATDFPITVTKGSYPVKVSYVLPGKEITTSTVDIEMYNPVK